MYTTSHQLTICTTKWPVPPAEFHSLTSPHISSKSSQHSLKSDELLNHINDLCDDLRDELCDDLHICELCSIYFLY